MAAAPVVQVLYDSGNGDAIDVTSDALPAGLGDSGNRFVYSANRWQHNLKTLDYKAAGTYTVYMTTGDKASYLMSPTDCSSQFVVQ